MTKSEGVSVYTWEKRGGGFITISVTYRLKQHKHPLITIYFRAITMQF